MLADEITRLKRAEAIAALDAGDAALAGDLATKLQAPVNLALSNAEGELLGRFVDWCAARSCRRCPAKQTTVASWILDADESDITPDQILATMAAISKMHFIHRLADPCSGPIVAAAVERVVPHRAPRSWKKDEQWGFWQIPIIARAGLERRERERDVYVRQCQNQIAELKSKLKTQDEPKAVEQKEQTNGEAESA
jgi:hypothetical protein